MPSLPPGVVPVAAICLVFAPSSLGAQSFGAVGDRAQGMGGAFVAVADDASAIYWNPAGLANVFKFDAQLDASSPGHPSKELDPGRSAFAGAAMPALGAALYRVRSAVSASGSRQNGGSGEVQVSALTTTNFGLTLVQSIVNRLVVGSTLRAVNGAGASGFDLDLGAIASLGDVRVGLAARNLRESLDLEREVRMGVAFVPRSLPTGINGPFSMAFDLDMTRTPTSGGASRRAAVGSEQWWAKGLFATRLGMNWNTLNASDPAFAGGLTVRLPHSLFGEGHVTKNRNAEAGWGAGLRMAF